MKIVIAPDSYKGCLSSIFVANYLEKGIKQADSTIETIKIPIADGGEGSVNAFVTATNGKIVKLKAHGPLMNVIDSYYGILGNNTTAIIEMAAISGLNLISKDKQNPLYTTTYGVGELIKHAIDSGYRDIIVGIGGSATNDGGVGMAQALGVKFYDKNSKPIKQGGKYLVDIDKIDNSNLINEISECTITIACDVKNPLYGKNGASYVYAKQKGASLSDIALLDKGLKHLSKKISTTYKMNFENYEGVGAAGGLGYGLLVFLNGILKPGIDILIDKCAFRKKIQDADLLITGEGKTDYQTAFGKAPVGLAKVAKEYNIPVICISGALGKNYKTIYSKGIDGAFSIIPDAMNLEQAIANAKEYLINFAFSITKTIIAVKSK